MLQQEYIEGWKEFERIAGRRFNHEQRKRMVENKIVYHKVVGRPPKRYRVIYTYWTYYLIYHMKTDGKL